VVTARKSALISAQVAGPIQKLTVRSGQIVKAGDLVVALDKTELSNKLVQAQFAEQSARAAAGSAGAKASALHQKAVAEQRLLKLGVSTPIQAVTSQDDYAATGAEASAASSKAAEACALAGSVVEGVTVSMDIEQLIYEVGRLQDAASLLNRLSRQ